MLKIHKSAKICEIEAKNGSFEIEKRKNCVATFNFQLSTFN